MSTLSLPNPTFDRRVPNSSRFKPSSSSSLSSSKFALDLD
jgi:hypothetical protein